jgi:hypothetical protein
VGIYPETYFCDSMQKKLAQSDYPTLRKRPKCGQILKFWANAKIFIIFQHVFDVFSGYGGLIEMIPFALSQIF